MAANPLTVTKSDTFASLVGKFQTFVDSSVIPLLFTLAFLFFLIGVVRFFFAQSDEAREKGREFALWGIIALVLLFSLWAVVTLFVNVLS
jgi:hypothetical protein